MASRRRLPSLSALRAFEAAARHGGFRSAADELNVTHSAISHQVKALEAYLGEQLFDRGSRAISLTESGRILFPVLRDSFDNVHAATELLRRRRASAPLAIQTYVTIASRWLLPRLQAFHEKHPSVPVALLTSNPDWDFVRDGADAAVLFPEERHADLDYTEIYRGVLFPVCSPEFLGQFGPIDAPADLQDQPLITVFPAENDWSRWFAEAGVVGDRPRQWVTVDTYLLAIESALAGDGVTLATMPFVAADLAAGRLVRLFDHSVAQQGPWCFICPKERRHEPRIVQFLNWLKEAAADDPSMRQ